MDSLISLPWCFSIPFLADPENITNTLKLFQQNTNPMTLAALAGQFKVLIEHDTRAQLSKIAAETLVLSLEQDILTLPSENKFLAENIPQARYLEIKDQAHCFHLEQPKAFCEIVFDFFK